MNNDRNEFDRQWDQPASQRPVPPAYGSTAWNGASWGAAQSGTPAPQAPAQVPVQTPALSRPAAPAGYTWQAQAAQPSPYYAPAQPQRRKKRKSGRFGLKLLAAVLACAIVSMGSVGAFAWMIQSGVVRIESDGDSGKTAAFTLYKRADSAAASAVVVEEDALTAQEIAANVTPSVVLVQNYQVSQSAMDFFGFYYGGEDSDGSLTPAGEGSGIIISADGYIVTNQHVVDGASALKVVTSDGITYEAELVGEDTQTDLAVIKVTTDDELTPAEFGSSSDLRVADEVMAIGNPGGSQLSGSVTFGRISALNRPVTNSDTGYTVACIQTDAAINPGNSGGALVDMNGHVIGINSSKIAATEYEGLGFAIPSDTVQPIVSDLIDYGYVKDRAAAGFSGQYIDSLTARWYGMNAGYYVTEVTSQEAQDAGLKRGDRILAIDDTQVTSANTLNTYIAGKKPGDTVTLTVARDGQTGSLTMTLPENTGKSEEVSVGGGYSYYY